MFRGSGYLRRSEPSQVKCDPSFGFQNALELQRDLGPGLWHGFEVDAVKSSWGRELSTGAIHLETQRPLCHLRPEGRKKGKAPSDRDGWGWQLAPPADETLRYIINRSSIFTCLAASRLNRLQGQRQRVVCGGAPKISCRCRWCHYLSMVPHESRVESVWEELLQYVIFISRIVEAGVLSDILFKCNIGRLLLLMKVIPSNPMQ